jgi:tetratricopeptide (TPR) repeat protein
VATALCNVATTLRMQGQLDEGHEALEMCEKALKIERRALGEDHVDVGTSLENIGLVYSAQGKLAEALEMYDKALATFDRALGSDSRKSAGTHYQIACSKSRSGDLAGGASEREGVGPDLHQARHFQRRVTESFRSGQAKLLQGRA